MKFAFAALTGAVAGLVGAAIWAAIAYYADVQIGWVAWIIGGGVGFATALGANAKGGADQLTGVIAAVIAIASVCAGKYAAVSMFIDDATKVVAMHTEVVIDDEAAQLHMAHQLSDEYETNGKALKWPEGKDRDNAETLAEFPTNLATDTRKRWAGMSSSDQDQYKQALQAQVSAEVSTFINTMSASAQKEGFIGSFGLFDIIFFGLAVVTAFRLGSMGSST